MALSSPISQRFASAIHMTALGGKKLKKGSWASCRLVLPTLGTTVARVILATLNCDVGSNLRIESTSSPKNSIRYGWSKL